MSSYPKYNEYCQDAKVISCVMKRGHAEEVVEALYQKKHILGVEYSTGRSQHNHMDSKDWCEVDMLTAVVSPEYAEEVFYDIFHLAKIAETEEGMVFQTNLVVSTNRGLPDLPIPNVS